jgi:hypothetical protein
MRSLVAFALGVGTGWALRSIADSPEGLGVKLLEIAYGAKERLSLWLAEERERLEDLVAEARSKVEPIRKNGPSRRPAGEAVA